MNNLVTSQQHDVSEIERMARAFAISKLFGVTNVEQAIALCLIAQAEGRHPASAAQDYHIIQGRPAKKADAMLRDFLSGGGKVEWHKLDDTVADATFSHPSGGSVRITWDMPRAKKAQLTTPMWSKYPRQMLRARVVSEGVRTVFPMATSGMYVPEEVQEFEPSRPMATAPENDPPMIEGTATAAPEEPKRYGKSEARPIEAEMRKEIADCLSMDDLASLWRSRPFQIEFSRLPADWQKMLVTFKDERKAELQAAERDQPASAADDTFPGDLQMSREAAE